MNRTIVSWKRKIYLLWHLPEGTSSLGERKSRHLHSVFVVRKAARRKNKPANLIVSLISTQTRQPQTQPRKSTSYSRVNAQLMRSLETKKKERKLLTIIKGLTKMQTYISNENDLTFIAYYHYQNWTTIFELKPSP